MSTIHECNRCARVFKYKSSLRRHQYKKLRPCRAVITNCDDCLKGFTNMDSLKKHKRQYCRFREYHSLQDFLSEDDLLEGLYIEFINSL